MNSPSGSAPVVSVILPNRNHAHYLPKAIEALLGQTLSSLELIVVDDASTDESADLVRGYASKDQRVKLLGLDRQHGIHLAVACGIEQATGEFVYIAAADDHVETCFIDRCVEVMRCFPQAGLCFSDPSEYYRDDDRAVLFPLFLSDRPVFFDAPALVQLLSRNYFHISPNTGIYRRSEFRAAGGYREELGWLADWFLTTAIALRHGVCYLPEQLTYVTIREDSYSATAAQDRGGRKAAFERLLALLDGDAYRDVRVRLREARLLPEYHLSTLLWLLRDGTGRRLLSVRLIGRILTRAGWDYLRDHMPVAWRRQFRRIASRQSRSGSA